MENRHVFLDGRPVGFVVEWYGSGVVHLLGQAHDEFEIHNLMV